MDDPRAKSETSGRWLAIGAAAACIVVGALVWAVIGGASSNGGLDDAEVCDTTEYEGCIARWDYLLEDDD